MSRRAWPRLLLLLTLVGGLAGCAPPEAPTPSTGSPSATITAGPTLTAAPTARPPTPTASAVGDGYVVFSSRLNVSRPVSHGFTFQINVLGTNSGQTDFTFCGPVPSCASGRTYTQALGVQPGFHVTYKFERASPGGDIYVFKQGSLTLDRDQTVVATYAG